MPIKARIDMLSTGIRTPVGVKVFGADLGEIERVARQIEQVLKTVPRSPENGSVSRCKTARHRRDACTPPSALAGVATRAIIPRVIIPGLRSPIRS